MFTHIVFFKLENPSKENIQRVREILVSMEGNIPMLRALEVGVDVIHSQRSYDVALITRFDSREEMDEYQVHPYHVNEVLKNLKPMLKASAAVDYEL